MLAPTMPCSDHNGLAAQMWGTGGRAYDDISFAISDALAHTAQRLNPQSGEEILDVATGTGWSARNVARRGAHVRLSIYPPNCCRRPRNCQPTSGRPSCSNWRTWNACRSRMLISMA